MRKQSLVLLRISEDVFKRAAHVDNQQDYDDIPKPTVLQLFQVSRVEIVPQVARLQLVGRGNAKQVLFMGRRFAGLRCVAASTSVSTIAYCAGSVCFKRFGLLARCDTTRGRARPCAKGGGVFGQCCGC